MIVFVREFYFLIQEPPEENIGGVATELLCSLFFCMKFRIIIFSVFFMDYLNVFIREVDK